jgi:apolipoprotein N-acyltransferase
VVDHAGTITATFDKFHLVPLGEYVPLRAYLPFLSKITPGDFDFSAGSGPRTLDIPGLPPVAPLICYEIIFPGRVVDPSRRPAWLLNLTNDAWFGTSTGPYQHLHQVRVRAVEEGLPLVRAANTGISAVIDSYGKVKASIPLNEAGILDEALPVALPPTPYSTYGGLLLIVVALTILLLYRVVIAVE